MQNVGNKACKYSKYHYSFTLTGIRLQKKTLLVPIFRIMMAINDHADSKFSRLIKAFRHLKFVIVLIFIFTPKKMIKLF